jgi:hypothetical protein
MKTHGTDVQSYLKGVQRPPDDALDTLVAHDADKFRKLIIADGEPHVTGRHSADDGGRRSFRAPHDGGDDHHRVEDDER